MMLPMLLLIAPLPLADDRPPVPADPIAAKGELLFADDFEGPAPDPRWREVVPSFAVESGVLKGTQARVKDVPAADGKGVVKAHAAVIGLEVPTGDSVVEVKFRLDGATMMDVEFDDRAYKGAHYGHICRAQVRPNGVTIIDERDGNMRNDIYAMKQDPANKAEVARLLIGRSVTYPRKFEPDRWYTLAVETVGDAMRVTIDGEPTAYLKSSGIAHPTKSKIEFAVAGPSGSFDALKVWSATPARP